MPKTVFITGASSGIGKATAKHFRREGWNVSATMRNPVDGVELEDDIVLVTKLDLVDPATIRDAVIAAEERFGSIDVLVNNAGYGAYGALEATPMSVVRRSEAALCVKISPILTSTGSKGSVRAFSKLGKHGSASKLNCRYQCKSMKSSSTMIIYASLNEYNLSIL